MANLRIITPVFNDWASCLVLLRELDRMAENFPHAIFVTAVNDGSTDDYTEVLHDLSGLQRLRGAEILHLSTNLGHQRAIAVGMCVATLDDSADAILVMDADGEDPPESISLLAGHLGKKKDFCVVARRRKRTETSTFQVSYFFYKSLFKMVTGKKIGFGNFSIFSRSYARRLVVISDLWNNLPAAVLRSRMKVEEVAIDRGRRYTGKSSMNFTSLVVHGLSGISVYADTIFVRQLLFTLVMFLLGTVVSAVVITLRLFFPMYATPGWATSVVFGFVIIIMQLLFTTMASILMVLNSRVTRLFIPIKDFEPYVSHRTLLVGDRFEKFTELSEL